MKLTPEGGYRLGVKAHVVFLTLWLLLCLVCGWLFYDSIRCAAAGIPMYPFFARGMKKRLEKAERRQMQTEFKDVMISVYSSLSAGATVEQSLSRALKDMERSLKPGARMIVELDLICRKMSGNIPVVQCLEEMSRRCGDEDIENFVQIIILGKKQGNNLAALVRSGVEKIQRRIEMNYEIEGMIGAKRNEFGFMCVIPAGIIAYMRCFSPAFMAVMYGYLPGALAMTACLVLYGAAIGIGWHILQIKI